MDLSTPDLVLSSVPGPLVLSVLVAQLVGAPLFLGLAAGSVPAGLAVGYGLFYAPPVEPEGKTGTGGTRGRRNRD